MAGYSINRIPESQRIFVSSVPTLWSSSGGSLNTSLDEKYPAEGSIQASLTVGQEISYNISVGGNNGLGLTKTTESDVGDTISAFVWIKTNKPIIVNFNVKILYPPSVSATSPAASASRSISVTSGEWTLLRLYDMPVVPNDTYEYPIGFSVTVQSIDGGSSVSVSLSHPIIYGTLDFINNPSIVDLMVLLPEFVRAADVNPENYTDAENIEPLQYQLTRFMEMINIHRGDLVDLVNRFIYQDTADGKNESDPETLSRLVDPTVADRRFLYWLAQFSGTRLTNPKTGFTPWSNIPPTWQQIDNIDGLDTVEDSVDWQVLQDYDIEPADFESFIRWQTGTGYYGINAGTKEAIIESVERVLTGTKTVVYSIISPFSWTIKIQTKKSETPDSALIPIGGSVDKIVELIERTRPLGFTVQHELIS